MVFDHQDLQQIRRHGLSLEEAERQIELFRHPPRGIRLDRPATPGDGILQLDPSRWPMLETLYNAAADRGRFSKFVPASGAATRMFRALLANLHDEVGPEDRAACDRFLAAFDAFPFADRLRAAAAEHGIELEAVRRSGDARALLEVLLTDRGLDLGHMAKALIPFHREADGARSPLEEHLNEGIEHLRDAHGSCRIHFTIPQHQELVFRDHFRTAQGHVEHHFGGKIEVSWSVQSPATDTLAADLDGQPFRLADGSLVLRPGGHGALLRNLHGMAGDLIFVRNIDNILPLSRRDEVLRWNRLLGGYLLEVESWVGATLDRLQRAEHDPEFIDEALRQTASRLGHRHALSLLGAPEREKQAYLVDRLDRPLRVCGVVPNSGEPGGGPFWVKDGDGGQEQTLQIVETSQIDSRDANQAAILQAATHFNPVHMVCRVRSHRGDLYDLAQFVDPATVFISRKSLGGRPLLALEHPGLWNGAMARWNTLFVEVPAAIFAPVKTVFDLLRPEHQPRVG